MNEIDRLTLAFLKSRLPPEEEKEAHRKAVVELAENLGYINVKQLQFVLTGERNLSTQRTQKLAELHGLTHLEMLLEGHKLLTGENMVHREIIQKVIKPPDIKIEHVPRFKTFDRTFAPERYIPIRLMPDPIAAGPPVEIREDEEPDSWVLIYASKEWIPNDPEHYTCAYIRGQSMWPILSDGDIVAIDHQEKDPRKLDKEMAAFRVGGGVTIKWLKFFADQELVIGVPENKDEFDTVITLKGEEINEGIVGRVAWWWAKRSPKRKSGRGRMT